TVSVHASGVVSFDLYRSAKQGSADSNGDSNEAAQTLASGLITLTAKVTDGDGDSNTANADIGSLLRIHDDGPTIAVNGATVPTLDRESGVEGNGLLPSCSSYAQ